MAGFIAMANFAGWAPMAFSIAGDIKSKMVPPTGPTTGVQVVLGHGEGDIGGIFPSIALFTKTGDRIGQSKDASKITEGGSYSVTISHDQNDKSPESAEYIMLSTVSPNAVCISAIYITDAATSYSWYGDYGHACGQSWFISDKIIGDQGKTPSCVWLDSDGTDNDNAQAMSFHLLDTIPSYDRLYQYNQTWAGDLMCKSTPRFSFWGKLLPDSRIPVFDPPLVYNHDSVTDGPGNDTDYSRIVDKPGQYDKSVPMYLGPTHVKRKGGSLVPRSQSVQKPKSKSKRNPHVNRLIVTAVPSHSARQVCESTTSWGPDVVSTSEGLFCDMTSGKKTLYPVCSGGVQNNCFDLPNKTLNLSDGLKAIKARHGSGVTTYTQTDFWGGAKE